MSVASVEKELSELDSKFAQEKERLLRNLAIENAIPKSITRPRFIHSESGSCIYRKLPGGLVDFTTSIYSSSGDGPEVSGLHILQTLEESGWEPLPASLVRWDRYRKTIMHGFESDIPEKSAQNYNLTGVAAVAPLWVTDSRGSGYGDGGRAHAYYKTPCGLLLQVIVKCPGFHVTARRKEMRGDWCFVDVSSACPESASHLRDANGDSLAVLGLECWLDTDKSMSARWVWSCVNGQEDRPLTPSEIFAQVVPG